MMSVSDPAATAPEKVTPSNIEAEEALLGSILINPDALFDVATFLKADDFFLVKNGWVWEAILAIHDRRDPIDFVTVTDELERQERIQELGGPVYISRLMDAVPSAIHAEAYGRIVEHTALRRRLLGAASQVAQLAYDERENIEIVLDQAEQALFAVSERRLTRDLKPIRDIVGNYYDHIQELSERDEALLGVPTGFSFLDKLLGGLQKSDLIIVAGRPGMGKTGFLLNIALNAAKRYRKRVAVFSLEMSDEQLVGRLVAAETGIDSQRLRRGALVEGEWALFTEATGRLAETLIFIDDTPSITPLQLRTKCRRLYAEYGLDLIVLDYLQLMSGDFRTDNRVQEISYISRHLKGLARELNVPVMAAAQLSRAVEQRQIKRPMLSDLRESGCLSGNALVQMADGKRLPIQQLAHNGSSLKLMALNQETWKLEPVEAKQAWKTGTRPVLKLSTQLGNVIEATANHRFRTLDGWKRLDQLQIGDHIALPRSWSTMKPGNASITEEQAALLGHLIGDGCTLPRHAVQYTSNQKELAELVAQLATSIFGSALTPRVKQERTWWQAYLSASDPLTHNKRNPVAAWLDDLGIWGFRSHEKRVPLILFQQPKAILQQFLKHLWATDGTLGVFGQKRPRALLYYATSSQGLAQDVQHLLKRVGIIARVRCVPQNGRGRDQWHIIITGKPDVLAFVEKIGVVGPKREQLDEIRDFYQQRQHNTNRDIIPKTAWRSIVEPARSALGMSQRAFQSALGTRYCGTALYQSNLSRERALQVSQIVQSAELDYLASSDVYWDKVSSIDSAGIMDVFDIEVPGHHNFIANDIVVHNSIEQDADVVMFIYRDDYYNEESEKPNIAEIAVAKHRNGPTDTVELFFKKELAQFRELERRQFNQQL